MFSSSKVCLAGFPGIGSVGKVAIDYIIRSMDCEELSSFMSTGYPPQVMVSEGQIVLFKAELKLSKDKDDLFLLSGDAQPLDVKNMYDLAGELLEVLESLSVRNLVTLAAYVGESEDLVMATASTAELVSELEESEFPILRQGFIGGLNGLMVGMAPHYGIKGVCILGSTTGDIPVDLLSARNVVAATSDFLELDVPLEALDSAIGIEGDAFTTQGIDSDNAEMYR
jgi:proteasome assembly chaperone (PAC2) family protein